MKQSFMIAALMVSMLSVAQAEEKKSEVAQAVNAACTQDAVTAKCEGEKVGTGLLKCLHAYKKANPSYKFADSCKSAMQTLRKDKKVKK